MTPNMAALSRGCKPRTFIEGRYKGEQFCQIERNIFSVRQAEMTGLVNVNRNGPFHLTVTGFVTEISGTVG